VESPTQPLVAWGYQRPSLHDPDDPVFRLMGLILSSGRTGLLYRELVQDQRVATDAQAVSAFPNGRYPCLFAFMLAPSLGHTVEDAEKALDALLTRLQSGKVDDEALSRARNLARAALISQLDGNQALASLLPGYYSAFGDWRESFTSIAALDKVTADDVQRVARKYLIPSQRTVAYIWPAAPPAALQPAQPAPTAGGRP
jgi:predicted Zn-dependent peptidase